MRKILWKDHPFLWSISKVRINFYALTEIWVLEIFDSETAALKIFLKICTETHFHFLFSWNEKIIAMCHLKIHIKCVAVIWFNEDWCSLKRPSWNNEPPNMLSHFLRLFTFSCLYAIFAKNVMKKLSIFKINFWNSFLMCYFAQFYDLKPATTKMAVLLI